MTKSVWSNVLSKSICVCVYIGICGHAVEIFHFSFILFFLFFLEHFMCFHKKSISFYGVLFDGHKHTSTIIGFFLSYTTHICTCASWLDRQCSYKEVCVCAFCKIYRRNNHLYIKASVIIVFYWISVPFGRFAHIPSVVEIDSFYGLLYDRANIFSPSCFVLFLKFA